MEVWGGHERMYDRDRRHEVFIVDDSDFAQINHILDRAIHEVRLDWANRPMWPYSILLIGIVGGKAENEGMNESRHVAFEGVPFCG